MVNIVMDLVQFIRDCEAKDKMYRFYKLKSWIRLRDEVLYESHNECYDCKQRGILTLGTEEEPLEVHHVNFVRDRPDLALSKFYVDRFGIVHPNLVALCHKCHDKRHERFGPSSKHFINEERW